MSQKPARNLGLEMVRATEAVINQAVQEERQLILVGRGAQAHLAQHEDTLHVYVVAPRELRVEATMRRLKVERGDAEQAVDEIDGGRRRYVKTYYDRHWEDAGNYHLALNTGVFNYEQCADLIIEAARARGWCSSPASASPAAPVSASHPAARPPYSRDPPEPAQA